MADQVIVVHPDDVNLADIKAEAAKRDANVVGNPYCPRGKMFLIDLAVLHAFDESGTDG